MAWTVTLEPSEIRGVGGSPCSFCAGKVGNARLQMSEGARALDKDANTGQNPAGIGDRGEQKSAKALAPQIS
eukprot:11566285-Alexandrium_andersonii.AAC.1